MVKASDGYIDRVKNKGYMYYRYRIRNNGQRYQVYAAKRRDLTAKIEELVDKLNAGQRPERITVGGWCQIWLREAAANTVKAKTRENYEKTVRNHILPRWGKMPLNRLSGQDIQGLINDLAADHEASTVNTIRTHIIVCMNTAVKWGYLASNPAKMTKGVKKSKIGAKAMTVEESQRLLHACADAVKQAAAEGDEAKTYLVKCYETVVYIALTTGMRQGEILALRPQDIDFEENMIHVSKNLSSARGGAKLDTTKTGKARNVSITAETADKIREWIKYQELFEKEFFGIFVNKMNLLFTNSAGGAINQANFATRYFRLLLARTGLTGYTFHSLRHTHATQLLMSGVHAKVVQERLGHSNLATTMNIYVHAMPNLQGEAIAATERIEKKWSDSDHS